MAYSRRKVYYVYVYLNPTKPGPFNYGKWKFSHEPFYIGKGKLDRAWSHINITDTRNKFKQNVLNKIQRLGFLPIILIKRKNLTEKQALTLEINLIDKLGRRDLKLGPLTNLTAGGEGLSHPSVTTRNKLRQANLGKTQSVETRARRSLSLLNNTNSLGHKHSKATCQKMSISKLGNTNRLGCTNSFESNQKRRTSLLGRPSPQLGRKYPDRIKPKVDCTAVGCTSVAVCRGMCNKHYQVWYKTN